MSGSLLQILAIGEEDKFIQSESFDASRPFRQMVKKTTSYATEIIDIDARFPSNITYGQSLTNIQIPRRGDLIRRMYLRMRVKRASGSTKAPGLELLDEISLWTGKTKLETLTGEYILAHDHATMSADELHARDRLVDFAASGEPQGTEKMFFVELPFFTKKTPLPLIAIQNQTLHLDISLRGAMASLDPTIQPDVDLLIEFIYLDDDERRWWTSNQHALLIERVQTQEETFVPRQSIINKVYTNVNESLGYDRVEGSGASEEINLGDRVQLVKAGAGGWTGRTEIIYDAAESARVFEFNGRFLIPSSSTGSVGLQWASYTVGAVQYGYTLEWSFVDETITATFKRNGTVICTIGNNSVTVNSGYATVEGASTSTSYATQAAAGEAWLVFDVLHHLEDDSLTLSVFAEGYVEGGYVASIDPVSTGPTITHTVREGYTAVDTLYRTSSFSAFADATDDVLFVADSILIKLLSLLPSSANFNVQSIPLFFRGPVRHLLWHVRPPKYQWTFGKYTTDAVGSEVQRYDMLHSAKVTLNGKDKTAFMSQSFFNVVEPLRLYGKSLPAGLHAFGFAEGNVKGLMPNGTVNMSRIQDTRLVLQMRSYNLDEANVLRLDESESVAEGRLFNRVVVHASSYNVLYVQDGYLSQAFM